MSPLKLLPLKPVQLNTARHRRGWEAPRWKGRGLRFLFVSICASTRAAPPNAARLHLPAASAAAARRADGNDPTGNERTDKH
ncbi:hypothetical protein SKAU_G00106800 [Synaphobranchus kaupii]|uniref:Uncharacterized protein n=1 Tax=Synaphobranchus kaupii TaxID=118154 RepID=A0A9Q1J6X3_SYNKA|nr:hypothetical protein SKAU_G00106800 [Synaphobranchus kaupii]